MKLASFRVTNFDTLKLLFFLPAEKRSIKVFDTTICHLVTKLQHFQTLFLFYLADILCFRETAGRILH